MAKRRYTIIAFIIAFVFWFIDASIHYYVYDEPQYEIIPGEFDELWMRVIIILLVIFFGIYADSSIRKLLIKEKQLEAVRIYNSMIYATQHILNNLLNQMQLFKMEALKSNDFDREIIKLYDNTIDEATDLIQRLSQVASITDENIWASVNPDNITNSSNKTDSVNAKKHMSD